MQCRWTYLRGRSVSIAILDQNTVCGDSQHQRACILQAHHIIVLEIQRVQSFMKRLRAKCGTIWYETEIFTSKGIAQED